MIYYLDSDSSFACAALGLPPEMGRELNSAVSPKQNPFESMDPADLPKVDRVWMQGALVMALSVLCVS